jgi:hypothetical protein
MNSYLLDPQIKDRFKWLFGEISLEDFLSRQCEYVSFFVDASLRNSRNDLIDIHQVNHLLELSEKYCNIDVALIHPNKVFPKNTFEEHDCSQNVSIKTRLNLARVYEFFQNEKAHIQITNFAHAMPRMREFLSLLNSTLISRCTSSVLISMFDSTPLPIKASSADTILIQVYGHSICKVFQCESSTLMTKPQQLSDQNLDRSVSYNMKQGDLVFIPHHSDYECETMEGGSVQLYLSCQYSTWGRFILDMIQKSNQDHDEMRQSFSHCGQITDDDFERALEHRIGIVSKNLSFESFLIWKKRLLDNLSIDQRKNIWF